VIERFYNGWRRRAIERFARRDFRLKSDVPYVSFTFDDFPLTALTAGGKILGKHGVRGTYFVSFRLLDSDSASGRIASALDVAAAVRDGHDLGCHTFDHVDGSVVSAAAFERSIKANQAALAETGLEADFKVFAYPLNGPAVGTKRVVERYFAGSRGGGQTFNRDVVDLNLLKSYFIDSRSRDNFPEAARLIEQNAAAKGWLIFSTHDVGTTPSSYGCTPRYLDELVRLSRDTGARVLPMTQVCHELGIVNAL
jgi:peptidoglycan/xylan/chitin deacetylase (PgdA/CDA1 family)